MRIDEVIGLGKPSLSFEFFPPKNDTEFEQQNQKVKVLKTVQPT